jgi:hypothetical protein
MFSEFSDTSSEIEGKAMGFQSGQRKQIYVSGSIQGTVIGRFAVYWVGYHMTLWHGMLLYGFLRGNLLRSGAGMSFWDYYVKFFQVNYSILLCAAAICPILLWDTLRVTHRIAGPVVRFKKALKQLSRGENVQPIKLRDGDLMGELQDAFNEFLASRQASPPNTHGPLSSTEVVALDHILAQIPDESQSENSAPVASGV